MIGLVILGLAALGLRLWTVLSLPGEPAWTAVAQLLQCVAGTLVVLAVARLGWILVPDRPYFGWVAGWAAAVYPPHLELVARPHVAPWAALTLTVLLLVVLAPRWNATRRGALVAGVLAGLLFVLEPILALAVPGCVAVFWLANVRRAALSHVALLLGVAVLIAGPWMVRNRVVHGRLLSQDYTAAATAGDPQPSYGQLCLRRAQTLFLGSGATLRTPHAPREESHHAERDEYVPGEQGQDARDTHRGADCQSASSAAGWQPAPRDDGQDTPVAFLTRASHVAVVAWLVLILIGLSVSWDRWRRLWPTYAVFAAVAAAHVLLAGVPWVRTALEPMTLVWASLAVAPLLVRLTPQRKIKIHRPGQQANDPFGDKHVLKGPHYEIPQRRRAG